LVNIIPEPSEALKTCMFKVIRSNTEIAITPPGIVRLRLTLVSRHRRYAADVQGRRLNVKVTGSKVEVAA